MRDFTFPRDRDIYSSGEVASIYFNIPIWDVEMLHMRRAVKILVEHGSIKPIRARNGAPTMLPWPGARRSYGLYSVRNHERYADPDQAIAHLAGVKAPDDTNVSSRKRASLARKRVTNALKYGRLGPTTQ